MKTFWKTGIAAVIAALICLSCKREQRTFRVAPSEAEPTQMVRISDLHAGGPEANPPALAGYEETAYAMSEGQQLYNSFNCVGCHAHGGGGMGVPLMDGKWIFGSEPQQVFATIVQGRPKGMPSFRGRLNEHQVWELVAYVRSLSGLTSHKASPGRDEHMKSEPPPNSIETKQPKNVSSPE
jgi:cytochrome c oxidase cbb3-type subunit 3